jgi:hypothetical protein
MSPPLVLDSDSPFVRRLRFGRELRLSGSAQFSVAAWRDLLAQIAASPGDGLFLADLRQECHGFVGGAAVSWYGVLNAECATLEDAQAEALEHARLAELRSARSVALADANDVKRGRVPGLDIRPVLDVVDEQTMVALPAGRYLRWRITDHSRPTDTVVDAIVGWARQWLGQAHLHVHCRGGKGRTALVMALCDLLRHAHAESLESILTRQRALTDYDLLRAPDPALAKAPLIAERARFLVDFYQYAKENPDGRPLGFSLWRTRVRSC